MCEVTSGRSENPCDAPAGLETSYVGDRKQVASFSVTAGVATIVMKAGKRVWPLVYEQGVSTFGDTAKGTSPNSSYARDHMSKMVLAGNTAEDIAMHERNGKTRVFVIHKLEDGSYEVLHGGKGGKWLDDRQAGTAMEDLNGTTVTVNSVEKIKAAKVLQANLDTLLVPAS